MCYTISINKTREFLEKNFGKKFEEGEKFKPSAIIKAFKYPEVPVICQDNPQKISLLIWGLIPYWVRDVSSAFEIRKKTFNARIESIKSKPSFKNLIRNNRCLIVVDGFYEWHDDHGKKFPYFITHKKQEVFALAGLYDRWINPENGVILKTFTIITTKANSLLEKIHNTKKRMPIILDNHQMQSLWLEGYMNNDFLQKISEPIDDKVLEAIQIDKDFIKENN